MMRGGLASDDIRVRPAALSVLSYRSEASAPPGVPELEALVAAAQRRNHDHGVTGMLLYDRGRFFQTLEGPEEGVEAIWRSIRRDPRHGAIDLLEHRDGAARLFSDWSMRLFRQDEARREEPAARSGTAQLAALVGKVVGFALAEDDRRTALLFETLVLQGWTPEAVVRYLIEPAARALGDAWLADECGEFAMTVALGRLQMAAHRMHRGVSFGGAAVAAAPARSILLVPAPGETHMLSASVMVDLFTNARWGVEIAFPETAAALVAKLAAMRPDAVDIALSDALARADLLP